MLDNARVTTTLAVTDIERAKDFYGNTLGLRELKDVRIMQDEVFYQVGDQKICLYERPTPSGSTATACSFEVDDVESVVQALRNNGVTFEDYDLPEMGIETVDGIATMDDYRSAWFKDPDGNILAIGDIVTNKAKRNAKTPIIKTH